MQQETMIDKHYRWARLTRLARRRTTRDSPLWRFLADVERAHVLKAGELHRRARESA